MSTAKKSIVITGASSGIGAALTRAFATDDHRLFICARRTERLAELAKDLPSVFYSSCDVSSETQVKEFFAQVRKQLHSVDVLMHCAAVAGPVGEVVEVDSESWFEALKVDLFGAFLVAKHVVPLMLPERRPRILLLSGGGAFDPMPNLSAYGVAKAATIRLVETLSVELASRNIAVNAFAPGFVATEFFDKVVEAGPQKGGWLFDTVVKLFEDWDDGDINVPIDCARFLISDAASQLTGKTISARHDPWDAPEFQALFAEIMASRLYATQRLSTEHLKGEAFADQLAKAAQERKKRIAQKSPPAAGPTARTSNK
jgi:NAD(P)-dependent dehydrogenase (short-subunit alcohol dehydrogenase family)